MICILYIYPMIACLLRFSTYNAPISLENLNLLTCPHVQFVLPLQGRMEFFSFHFVYYTLSTAQ